MQAAITACPATGVFRARRCLLASNSRSVASHLQPRSRKLHLARAEGDGSSEQATQQPSQPQQQQEQQRGEEEPIWVRRERERALQKEEGGADLPFGAYLLFSAIVAIAAVGSIFEYANQRPVFDVIQPDSPFYTPILGFFAVTGLPVAGFLFVKAVQAANKAADRMDKLDGY